ncbi:hypothetical protein PQF38_005804, partial [Klebsiella pneumoniae]
TRPLVVTFTRLRAVRRKGVNEYGPVKPSMPDVKSFCGFRQKVFMAVRQQCMDGKTGCACLSPGERTQRGEKTRQGMSRNPPQRRNARARNGVAPYSPAAVCRGAKSAGDGA